VHTAGTDVFATFDRISPEEFKRVIDVNLMGQVMSGSIVTSNKPSRDH